MYPNRRSITRRISGAIILLGLALTFGFGHFNLPLFFVVLAFAILISALGTLNLRGVYSGIVGFFWMLILALFFLTHSWIWLLVGAIISIILGSLLRPILIVLLGINLFRIFTNQQSQPVYQPSQQPYQPYEYPPQQSYQQGYQPPVQQPGTYREGEVPYYYPPSSSQSDLQDPSYPSQAEMPQAQYPQMPPLE
ncbi:MAG TPA: hypothetical protein VGL94_14285 [Ktedonobacteraceae bacterium]